MPGKEAWCAPYYSALLRRATRRNRKLLLHRKEIAKLERETVASGRTIVPLSIYFSDGYAKVELAVATGKKDWDKRNTIAERVLGLPRSIED